MNRGSRSDLNRLQNRAVLAILSCSACWGVASVFTKGMLAELPALELLIVQLFASASFLWLAAAVTGQIPSFNRRTLRLSAPGILDPGLSYILNMFGLSMTTASKAALITSLQPLLILVLAYLFLGECLSSPVLMVGALCVVGEVLIMAGGSAALGLADGSLIGDGLVFSSVVCAALYCLCTREMCSKFGPLVVAALHQSAGLCLICAYFIFTLLSGAGSQLHPMSMQQVIGAALCGVVQYAFSLWLYLYAITILPLGVAAVFLVSIPIFTVGAAGALLGERLLPLQMVGALIILASMGGLGLQDFTEPPEMNDA